MAVSLTEDVAALIASKQGIWLDVACGNSRQPGTVGMDCRALPNVDIVWDIEETPWPLPDACAYRVLMSHIVEHLKPWRIFPIFEEVHRVLKPHGQVMIATPYPGPRFWQDPTHIHAWNEHTCRYWDPFHPSKLWEVYKPSPFLVEMCQFDVLGDLHVIMSKIPAVEEGDGSRNGHAATE